MWQSLNCGGNMKKSLICLVLALLFLGATFLAADDFGYKITDSEVILEVKDNLYIIEPDFIRAGNYLAYFAGKDSTSRKDMTVDKKKRIKVVMDKPDRKIVRLVCSLKDLEGNILKDYELELNLEIRKNLPCLIVMSKFRYLGGDRVLCIMNWGISDSLEYYSVPERGKVITMKLPGRGKITRRTKIGIKPWIYAHAGKGEGIGLITPGLLGKQEDFIYVNYVQGRSQRKRLERGKSMDLFMIFLPIEKGGTKPIASLYERVKNIEWNY